EYAFGDIPCLLEGKAAPANLGEAVADEGVIVAPQPLTAFASNDQQHDPLAGGLDLPDLPARLAQDRGIKSASETPIRSGDADEMGLVLAGAYEQRGGAPGRAAIRPAREASTRSIRSAKGRAASTCSTARRSREAATTFIAEVIFWVDLTLRIRSRKSFRLGMG